MILVDTSVLIDFFRGVKNPKTEVFDSILQYKLPYGITPYTFAEILQGAENDGEYEKIKDYLSTQVIYFLPSGIEIYEEAARISFDLHAQGFAPRSTADILTVLTAKKNGLLLLHNDRDFDILISMAGALSL